MLQQLKRAKNALLKEMQKEMVEIAMSAAGKLIGEQNAEELDRQAIDAYIKEAQDGE